MKAITAYLCLATFLIALIGTGLSVPKPAPEPLLSSLLGGGTGGGGGGLFGGLLGGLGGGGEGGLIGGILGGIVNVDLVKSLLGTLIENDGPLSFLIGNKGSLLNQLLDKDGALANVLGPIFIQLGSLGILDQLLGPDGLLSIVMQLGLIGPTLAQVLDLLHQLGVTFILEFVDDILRYLNLTGLHCENDDDCYGLGGCLWIIASTTRLCNISMAINMGQICEIGGPCFTPKYNNSGGLG